MSEKKVYNTFEFIANLSLPKETEKFKNYTKTQYDSKWVNEELKINARIPDSSELLTIKDGYFNKSDYSFEKQGLGKKKDDGTYEQGSKIKVSWKDRTNKTILDKIVNYQKFVLDLSNNKERYDIRQAIEKLNDDAINDEDLTKIKNQFKEIIGETTDNKDIKKCLEEELTRLEGLKTEYLSKVDMIPDIKKLLNTAEGTNTVFKITGNINYSEWKGKVYRSFDVQKIEKATDKEKQKLKLNGMLDIYFNSTSLDESTFETSKKYIVNAWTKTYDSQLKQQIYVPIILIADGSKLDFENEKHVKRLNGLVKPFRFDIEGKEKDEDKIYQIQFEVKIARGAERVEITMDDLTEYQKECIEDGIMTFEEAVIELGGNKYGDRVDETRLFKVNIKDFPNGAEITELTPEDFVIEREDKQDNEQTNDDKDSNTEESDEEDVDDLI